MNDDIKEILDYLQENSKKDEATKQLVDYITNLQQENEELKKNQRYYKNGVFSLEYDKETMSDMIDELKQENERLKEIWEDTRTFIKDNKRLVMNKNGYDVYEDYKSRIEKAVEYLKSKEDSLFMSFSDDLLDHDELIDKKIGMTLLNILNGRSDE